MLPSSGGFSYVIEWDPAKARSNIAKHGVNFGLASTVLLDPLALTILDEAHSGEEARWVTLGQASNGVTLVLIHTWQQIAVDAARVRIISARKATKAELHDYEENRDEPTI